MKILSSKLTFAVGVILSLVGWSDNGVSQEKSGRHVFLLIGQSNMAGRAKIEASDKEEIPGAFLWNIAKKEWEAAAPPYNLHSPSHKGPAMQQLNCGPAFVKAYRAKHPDVEIGVVCVARGGTSIRQWNREKPDNFKLYPHAVDAALAALETDGSVLKGILWHQGESDSSKSNLYPEQLTELVKNLREDLKSPEVPFVFSQLGSWGDKYATFNAMIVEQPANIPHSACITTEGLKDKDGAHFDTAGQRGLGKRYAAALEGLISKK